VGRLMRRVKAHDGYVSDVAFMPDGKGLLSGDWDSCLRYWDVSSLYNPGPRIHARSQTIDDSHLLNSGVEDGFSLSENSQGTRFVCSIPSVI
jgi:WD40 repeat protein